MNKDQWWAVALQLVPDISRAEFERQWADFLDYKRQTAKLRLVEKPDDPR